MRKILLLALLPIAWVPLVGVSGSAGCAVCVTRTNWMYMYEEHAFGARLGVNMDCEAFNSCHVNWQAFDCYERHYPCASALRMNEVEAVLAAAASGDGRALRQAMASSPEAVRLDPDRGVLQVFGCGGDVIAHVPLDAAASHSDD